MASLCYNNFFFFKKKQKKNKNQPQTTHGCVEGLAGLIGARLFLLFLALGVELVLRHQAGQVADVLVRLSQQVSQTLVFLLVDETPVSLFILCLLPQIHTKTNGQSESVSHGQVNGCKRQLHQSLQNIKLCTHFYFFYFISLPNHMKLDNITLILQIFADEYHNEYRK